MRAVYRVIILMIFVLLISVFSTEASRITAVDTHHGKKKTIWIIIMI